MPNILLYAIHSLSTGGFFKKNRFYSGFKNLRIKKPESIREQHFVEGKNEGRKLDNDSSLRRLEFMPRTSTKNVVQEFHLCLSSNLITVHG
jgi:hypothetical protein